MTALYVALICVLCWGCGYYVGRNQGIKYVQRRFNEVFDNARSR